MPFKPPTEKELKDSDDYYRTQETYKKLYQVDPDQEKLSEKHPKDIYGVVPKRGEDQSNLNRILETQDERKARWKKEEKEQKKVLKKEEKEQKKALKREEKEQKNYKVVENPDTALSITYYGVGSGVDEEDAGYVAPSSKKGKFCERHPKICGKKADKEERAESKARADERAHEKKMRQIEEKKAKVELSDMKRESRKNKIRDYAIAGAVDIGAGLLTGSDIGATASVHDSYHPRKKKDTDDTTETTRKPRTSSKPKSTPAPRPKTAGKPSASRSKAKSSSTPKSTKGKGNGKPKTAQSKGRTGSGKGKGKGKTAQKKSAPKKKSPPKNNGGGWWEYGGGGLFD